MKCVHQYSVDSKTPCPFCVTIPALTADRNRLLAALRLVLERQGIRMFDDYAVAQMEAAISESAALAKEKP